MSSSTPIPPFKSGWFTVSPSSSLFSAGTIRSAIALLCLTLATSSMAQWRDEEPATTATYVDSVHQWGAWELDIEPAAGGITPAASNVLTARNSNLSLRINSIAALAPVPGATVAVPPVVVPPSPVLPSIRPISPNIPIPVGGPNDGF